MVCLEAAERVIQPRLWDHPHRKQSHHRSSKAVFPSHPNQGQLAIAFLDYLTLYLAPWHIIHRPILVELWRNQGQLAFFDHLTFYVAPWHVIHRPFPVYFC